MAVGEVVISYLLLVIRVVGGNLYKCRAALLGIQVKGSTHGIPNRAALHFCLARSSYLTKCSAVATPPACCQQQQDFLMKHSSVSQQREADSCPF